MNGVRPTPKLPMEAPPTVSAEQILLYGKRQSRLIRLEANVIGYFGHIFRKSGALASGGAPCTRVAAVSVSREITR